MKSLQNYFGPAFLSVYGDMPLNTPRYERNEAAMVAGLSNAAADFTGVACIHGHFLPLKYLLLSVKREVTFITWLRDPLERLVSHYYYWKKYYDPGAAPWLHRRMVEENWSLERFCLSPELQNVYGQFFWGFPLEYFDFIGITEHYAEDLAWFSQKYLQTSLEAYAENVGNISGRYPIADSLRREIERFHEDDIKLYGKALAMRQARLVR